MAARDAAATLLNINAMLTGPGVQAAAADSAGSGIRAVLAVAEQKLLETEKVRGPR